MDILLGIALLGGIGAGMALYFIAALWLWDKGADALFALMYKAMETRISNE